MGCSAASNWSHIQAKKKCPGQRFWGDFKEEKEINGIKHTGGVYGVDIFHTPYVAGSDEAVKARAGGAFASGGVSCRAVGA